MIDDRLEAYDIKKEFFSNSCDACFSTAQDSNDESLMSKSGKYENLIIWEVL